MDLGGKFRTYPVAQLLFVRMNTHIHTHARAHAHTQPQNNPINITTKQMGQRKAKPDNGF